MTGHHRGDPGASGGIGELPMALRRQAEGMLCAQAAAEVLVGHHSWLVRDDFVARFVETFPALRDGALMAVIDWGAALAALDAGGLACSSSEEQMLRIAASLAVGLPLDLSAVLTGLDENNLAVVIGALAHAGGALSTRALDSLPSTPHAASTPTGTARAPSRNDGVTVPCPVCATPMTSQGRRRYCSDACRQAGHRRRHSAPARPPELAPGRPQKPVTVYACPSCESRQIGEQYCWDCVTFMRKVGTGGSCPACDEPIAYNELTGG